MTSIDIDYFDLLSNEIIASVFSYLDLVSLFRLARVSHRLEAFKDISNEKWRSYYAQRWFVEDKELAIYQNTNWQNVYYQRIKSERDYLLWLEKDSMVSAPANGENQDHQKQDETDQLKSLVHLRIPPEGGNEGLFYKASSDPWAVLLRSNFQPSLPCCSLISAFFADVNFAQADAQREVASGRFEILVSAIAKNAVTDVNALKYLELFKDFLGDDYKDQRKLPFGLLGLLAKYLDLSLPPDLLMLVVNVLWIIASGDGGIGEDFFVGLDLVSKTTNIFLKATDPELRHACLSIMTWFNPDKPENQRALINPSFIQSLLEQLEDEHKTMGEDLRWYLRILLIGGGFNLGIIKENRTVTKLLQYSREHDPMGVAHLFSAIRDLCIDSDELSLEVLQDDNAVDYIMGWIKESEEIELQKAAKRAVGVLDMLVETDEGAEQLLDRGAVELLLPFMENPKNTHLFFGIYGTLRTLTRYANENGFGDEVFAKLLEHKEALLNPNYDTLSAKLREECDNFWTTFSCATSPPRDVSIKLIDRSLPLVISETKLNIKKDAGLLLANLAEIDMGALEGKDLTELFNYLAEYLINFDPEKEKVELARLELEQDGKRPALIAATTEEAIEEDAEHDHEIEGEEEFEENSEDEEEEEEGNNNCDSECPWPLNVLAQIVRIENLKPLAIQNERLMNKLFTLFTDESYNFETHFLVMFFFSHLLQMPGWDSDTALQYMEEFAIEAEYDIDWSYAFSKVEPYAHLLQKDLPTPVVILGSWFLAHMSTTEPGRKALKKELDPKVLKWMQEHPHPRVGYNMDQFDKNMKKKARRDK